MACRIFQTEAGISLKAANIKIREGFFETKDFLERFGNWHNNEIPYTPGDLFNRVNPDGSPFIIVEGNQAFYLDKGNNKLPIVDVPFISIPDDIREEISMEANDAIYYQLYRYIAYSKGAQLPTIEEVYDEVLEELKDSSNTAEVVIRTLTEDREDHIRFIHRRLKADKISYNTVEEKIILKEVEDGTPDNLFVEAQEVVEEGDEAKEFTEEDENEEENSEEQVTDFTVKIKASYERSSYDGASSNVRFLLQFIPDTHKNGSFKYSPNIPSLPQFVDPALAFRILAETLSTVIPTLKDPSFYLEVSDNKTISVNLIDKAIDKLKGIKNKFPWLDLLIDHLEGSSEMDKIEFVRAFSLQKNNIYTTEIQGSKYKTMDTTGNSAMIKETLTDFSDIIINKLFPDLSTETQQATLKEGLKNITDVIITKLKDEQINFLNRSKERSQNMQDAYNIAKEVFNYLKLDIDFDVFSLAVETSIKDSGIKEDKSTSVNLYKVSADIVSKFYQLTNLDTKAAIVTASSSSKNFGTLAKAYNDIYSNVSEHMATVGKKRLYLYSQPTVLSRQIEEWKENPEIVKLLLEVPKLANSVWLKHWVNNPTALDNLKVSLRGQIQAAGKATKGKDAGDIKKADYIRNEIYNTLRNGPGKPAIFSTQIPADKNREYLLNPGVSFRFESLEDAYKQVFKGYVKDEMFAMWEAHRDIMEFRKGKPAKLKAVYHLDEGGNISTFTGNKEQFIGEVFKFKLFNLNNLPNFKAFLELIKTPNSIYTEMTESAFSAFADSILSENDAKSVIISGLGKAVQKTTEYTDKILPFSYEEALLDPVDLSQEDIPAFKNIDISVRNEYKELYGDYNYKEPLLRDFALNQIISKIEYAKLFTGPLQFYKSEKDYIKRIPETYIDGIPLVTGITENDLLFTAVAFDTEFITNSDLLKSEHLSDATKQYYRRVNRTDGQGWITPDRWEFIMRRTGKINAQNEYILTKLQNQWKSVLSNAPIDAKDELSYAETKILSTQSLKGVFFKNDTKYGPTYIKYSAAVLIPSVFVNSPKAMNFLKFMTDNKIDEAIDVGGIKVGSAKPITIDEYGNVSNYTDNNKMVLDNRNWRLQQDLPTKTLHDNKIGTQIQKIIIDGLRLMPNEIVSIKNGKPITAGQLADKIEKSLAELSNEGVKNFLSKFGINQDTLKVVSLSAFYKPLIAEAEAEGIPFNNLVKALKQGLTPNTIPSVKDKVMATFFSSAKKAATNLLTPGGGFIQVSDHLIGKEEIKGSGIKLLVSKFTELKPPKIEDRRVIPGQLFLPHKLIVKLIPNYKTMSIEDIKKVLNKDVKRVIGYRIPTQARASADLFDIVGILPESMGDSVIAYGEITAKTGADFDIDKLFLMLPNLVQAKTTGKLFRATKGIKGKQNEVFANFEIALKAMSLYEKMMTAVDNPTTQDFMEAFFPEEEKTDLNIFSFHTTTEIRFNLRAGKTGIGSIVNANNDGIKSQGKFVKFLMDRATKGTPKHDFGNQYMDELYSESLTSEEIDIILPALNEQRKKANRDPFTREDIVTRTISSVFSELTNAYVDIANRNAFITKANWNSVTESFGTLLLRKGMHQLKVNLILYSPAITELLAEMQKNEGVINNKSSEEIRERLLTKYLTKYEIEPLDKIAPNDYNANLNNLDFEALVKSALARKKGKEGSGSKEELYNNILILNFFDRNIDLMTKYTDAIAVGKVGEIGAKRGIGDLIMLLKKIDNVLTLDIGGVGMYGFENKYYDADGNKTLLMTFHENTIGLLDNIITMNPDIFGTLNSQNIKVLSGVFKNAKGKDVINSAYKYDKLFEALDTYVLSGFAPLNKFYTREEEEAFFREILALKDKNIPLFKKINRTKEEGVINYTANRISTLKPRVKNVLVSNWRDLEKNNKALSDYLAYKAFQASGFQKDRTAFHELIPVEWFTRHDIRRYMRSVENTIPPQFIHQLLSNEIADEIFTNFTKLKKSADVRNEGIYTTNSVDINNLPFPLVTNSNYGIMELMETITFTRKNKAGLDERVKYGVYRKVPKVEKSTVYYNIDNNIFNAKLGIDPNLQYINESKDIEREKVSKEGFRDIPDLKRLVMPVIIKTTGKDNNNNVVRC